MFSIIQPLFLEKLSLYIHIPNNYLGLWFEFEPQRISDLALRSIRDSSILPLFAPQLFCWWSHFCYFQHYWPTISNYCKVSNSNRSSLKVRKIQKQIEPYEHLIFEVHVFTCNFRLKNGSYKITYWLGRYSFLEGFIASKKREQLRTKLSIENIKSLWFFWHNKTQKERVSTESINYLIWTCL